MNDPNRIDRFRRQKLFGSVMAFGLLTLLTVCQPLFSQDMESMPIDDAQRFLGECETALKRNAMIWSDLAVRTDYATPDKFRLPLIDSLMEDPKLTLQRIDEMATSLENESLVAGVVYILLNALSLENKTKPTSERFEIRSLCGRFSHLDPELKKPIELYLSRLPQINGLRTKMIANLGEDQRYLVANLSSLLRSSTPSGDLDPFGLNRIEKQEQAMADSLLRICERIDLEALASLSTLSIEAAEDLKVSLQTSAGTIRGIGQNYRWLSRQQKAEVDGEIVFMGMTDLGAVVVGGESDNRYQGSFALIIDLGGNDSYSLEVDIDTPFKLRIDLGGNDNYLGNDFGVAGAVLGTSIIFDLAGNDIYNGEMASLGAAVCGLGVLYDAAGADIYNCSEFGQGAGFLGVGILLDTEGIDLYMAGMNSQGFGYTMGAGCLLEKNGNDTYLTKMSQTDILRYDDHYLTLSQGCAFGFRPHYSGGIGLLVDCEGNDLYSSDIFGQGVGYWFAIGGLVDRSGHDKYISYQYAQGAGIHLALGILIDNNGNDFYQSKGVSQGCGHDLAFGLLADFSGNDSYTAADLSQGAGNANATGILYDADGIDSYSSKSEINVNGYGDFRREFGSIGLHVDCAGKDFYGPVGENKSIWQSGKYGLGRDLPQPESASAGDLIVKEYPFEERQYSTEDLFILASRGEPRFRKWQKYAFEKMIQDVQQTIDYLQTVLDTEDARERHTIKDILVRIGQPAIPMLTNTLQEGNDLAKAEASWILGLIQSKDAFAPLLDLSRDHSWKLRSNALNSLGKLKDLDNHDLALLAERVDQVLSDPDEVFYVKKDAAFAVGEQQLCGCLPSLINLLSDRHFSSRLSAAEAIAKICNACHGAIDTLLANVDSLNQLAVLSLLRGIADLNDDFKVRLLEKLCQSGRISEDVAPIYAQVLASIKPTTTQIRKQIDNLSKSLPEQHWELEAILKR